METFTQSHTSRQLKEHEKNYSPFLLEAATTVWGMDNFNKYLRGTKFILCGLQTSGTNGTPPQ